MIFIQQTDHFVDKGGFTIPIQVFFVWLIGLLISCLGYLIYSGKTPFIVNFFNFIPEYDPRLLKILGTIIIIVGVIVIFLPFVLGTENMNI